MSGRSIEHLLTGTALALALTLAGPAVAATDEISAAIEALVPVPDPANVPPPSIADVGGPATATISPKASAPAPAIANVAPVTPPASEAVPLPEPANVPPPAMKDIAKAPPSPDAPVAEELRELFAGKIDRIIDRKNERKAIEGYYAAHDFAPLWIENGAVSARGKAAVARLKQADADGLDPSDYRIPDFAAAASPEALADAELRLTIAVLTYARHAQTGRVHYSRVSADIIFNLVPPEPAEVLAKMADAKDAGEALASYNPPHEGYRALREKLAEARGRSGDSGPVRIDSGPVLKVGMQDARVPLLRERLGVTGDGENTTFDKPLAEAVKKFQRAHDLSATGTLNPATINALNGPRRDRDADVIIANMERWRWLPRDLGKAYVMVNIPEYTLRVVNNGTLAWKTRVVVGKPSMPTPLLSETMKFITVNPTWNVPPSIIQNEYLPALQQDPTALERIGLKVEHNRDGTIHVYQPPGDRNALGRIRFNFPNKFLVYQHDTPDKHLFANEKRAYSHGCMRVQDPLKYGEVLLSIALPKEGYTQERLRRMFGSAEQNINFPTPIPVHLTYQTASVDEAGKLVIREDIYGRDARVLAALRGEDRRFADIAVERHEGTRRQAIRMPLRHDSGFNFFGRLFR
jgi:murein L,D-transpeptidase YcbB/YkuD